MPLTSIDVREGRTPAEKQQLLQAVHEALVEALKIPDHDRKCRLREYAPEAFWTSPGKSERYTIVRTLGALGTSPADVFIVLHEPRMENWGVQGGLPASEVDLGFQVDV